jgi:phosphoesterase RecJ-like protein
VHEEVFERDSAALLRLTGAALAGLRLEEGGRLAWVSLTRDQIAACGAETEDTSDIINELLRIDGVRVAVLFKQLADGRTKLSFRSKGGLDVNRLAAAFGGGGHTNAAGAVVAMPMEQAFAAALQPCRDLLRRAAATAPA